jgi:hypothetical protein
MDSNVLRGLPAADLADGIRQLAALQAATHRAALELVVALDRRRAWRVDGASSMADWLTQGLGLGWTEAREWVRVGRALAHLPQLAEAYAEGSLSWQQIKAVTRFATAEDDAEWARRAPGCSPAALQRMARRIDPPTSADAREAHRVRSFRWWWETDQLLRVAGRLPAADGSLVVKAVTRAADRIPGGPDGKLPFDQRCADALAGLASAAAAADRDADRATVVVHVDAEALAGGDGASAELEDGPVVAVETARRLACDGRLQLAAHRPEGAVAGVGRTARKVPPSLGRVLRQRDRGCRFPRCGRTGGTHSHHLVHWADGGGTDADNLVTLCRYHHHLVHEGGWRVAGDPAGEIIVVRPDGRRHRCEPPRLSADTASRLLEPLLPRSRSPAGA